MRHQYFGDRRDFYKYELLLDLAERQSQPMNGLNMRRYGTQTSTVCNLA